MYQAHFGLKTSLFAGAFAPEETVFIGPRQQLIVANFKVALTTFDSAIVLTGPAGVGKTTIASAALRATATTRVAIGWVGSAPANGAEMLEHLLAEFGFNPHRMGRVERLQMWRQFLNEMNATDSRVFVIAEHADEMEADVLRMLEAATAADPNGCPGANLILLGQPALNDHLKLPALASLTQRVRLRQRLEPLTIEELEAYLTHRVTLAGGSFEQVFERGAIEALHEYSAGIPRVVNNLCETALTLAATGAEQHLTAQLVRRVAVSLYGIEPADVEILAAPADVNELLAAVGPPPAVMPAKAAVAPIIAPLAAAMPAAIPRPAAAPVIAEPAAEELPVLTDAIETALSEAKAPLMPRQAARHDQTAAPPKVKQPAETSTRPSAPGAAPPLLRSAPMPAAPPPSAPTADAAPAGQPMEQQEDELTHRTQTLRALSSAKSLDDISSSMAETLFGDADLDMLSAALASAGWSDLDDSDDLLEDLARSSTGDSVTIETPRGKFASFGAQPDAALELDEPPTATGSIARKIATTR